MSSGPTGFMDDLTEIFTPGLWEIKANSIVFNLTFFLFEISSTTSPQQGQFLRHKSMYADVIYSLSANWIYGQSNKYTYTCFVGD